MQVEVHRTAAEGGWSLREVRLFLEEEGGRLEVLEIADDEYEEPLSRRRFTRWEDEAE